MERGTTLGELEANAGERVSHRVPLLEPKSHLLTMHAFEGLLAQYVWYHSVIALPVPGSVPVMTSEQ